MTSKQEKKNSSAKRSLLIGIAIVCEVAICGWLAFLLMKSTRVSPEVSQQQVSADANAENNIVASGKRIVVPLEMEVEVTPEPTPDPLIPDFHPHAVDSTIPDNYISTTGIQLGDEILDSVSDYYSEDVIEFGAAERYTAVDGIVTFRGNNFRNSPVYGTADLTERKFGDQWAFQTGSLVSNGNSWSGSGWTGQPLMENGRPRSNVI